MKKFALLALVCALTLSATAAWATATITTSGTEITIVFDSGHAENFDALLTNSGFNLTNYNGSDFTKIKILAPGCSTNNEWSYIAAIVLSHAIDYVEVEILTTGVPDDLRTGMTATNSQGISPQPWSSVWSAFDNTKHAKLTLIPKNLTGTNADNLSNLLTFMANSVTPLEKLSLTDGTNLKLPQGLPVKAIDVDSTSTLDLTWLNPSVTPSWGSYPKFTTGSTLVLPDVSSKGIGEVLRKWYGNSFPDGVKIFSGNTDVTAEVYKEYKNPSSSSSSGGCDTGAAFMLFLPALLALAPWKKR